MPWLNSAGQEGTLNSSTQPGRLTKSCTTIPSAGIPYHPQKDTKGEMVSLAVFQINGGTHLLQQILCQGSVLR